MKFIKTVFSYLISFLVIAWAINYFDPNAYQEFNNYVNPPTSQSIKAKPSSSSSNQAHAQSQTAELPSLNQPHKQVQEHWNKKDLTIYIQAKDKTARQDFLEAINAWNTTKVLNLALVKNANQADIVCDIQDLTANTKQNGLETLKTLGDTEVSYDQNNGEIMHAKSVIDIYQIQGMPHDQQVWIAEHELGHAFGLQHTTPGSHTVMEPQNLTTGITKTDIQNLKNIYQ